MSEQGWTDFFDEEAYAARFVAEHGGHQQHWCVGNVMRCSCGEAVGRLRGEGLFIAQSCRVCPLVVAPDLGEPYETPDGRM